MASTTPVVQHGSLETSFQGVNHLHGVVPEPVSQYRGIKYGIVPARFRRSRLNKSYPSTCDATQHGYAIILRCVNPLCSIPFL